MRIGHDQLCKLHTASASNATIRQILGLHVRVVAKKKKKKQKSANSIVTTMLLFVFVKGCLYMEIYMNIYHDSRISYMVMYPYEQYNKIDKIWGNYKTHNEST